MRDGRLKTPTVVRTIVLESTETLLIIWVKRYFVRYSIENVFNLFLRLSYAGSRRDAIFGNMVATGEMS